MGCDIHFFVERFENGAWRTCDTFDKSDGYWSNYDHAFYSERNYDLFSMLGNVRNGYGFAGVKTGEGFVPLTDRRGVPEDSCPEYLEMVQQWDGDGHSHSYCTVAELLAYDWTQKTEKTGFVSPRGYVEFVLRGSPNEWSGGVYGGTIRHLSNEDMRLLITEGEDRKLTYADLRSDLCKESLFAQHYTQVSWSVAYYECTGTFLSHTMPRLWRLGPPDLVRCCFFFDN